MTKCSNLLNSALLILVRIAINFDQARDAEILVSELKALGYQVGLNLMQAHDKSGQVYKETAETIQSGKRWTFFILPIHWGVWTHHKFLTYVVF